MTPYITTADVAVAKRILLGRSRDRSTEVPDFTVRPISEAWRYTDRRPAYRTAVANVAYIWRDSSPIDAFGPMPTSFAERRCELRGAGLMLPGSAPVWAAQDYRIWEEADAAVTGLDDPTAVRAWHVLMQIPDSLPADRWRRLVTDFVERELASKGAAVAWAIHALEGEHGWIISPHAHLVVVARGWRHNSRSGLRHPAWIGSGRAQQRLGSAWRRCCAFAQRLERVLPGKRIDGTAPLSLLSYRS